MNKLDKNIFMAITTFIVFFGIICAKWILENDPDISLIVFFMKCFGLVGSTIMMLTGSTFILENIEPSLENVNRNKKIISGIILVLISLVSFDIFCNSF